MEHQSRRWTFLTNRARVLMVIVRDPTTRLHELATACQIAERTVQRIVADLETAGHLRKERLASATGTSATGTSS
jgi:DNA-binding MarR family transcriptional regulator